MEYVLVDTCVFIDFLRPQKSRHKPTFKSLLTESRIVLSPFVKLELLMGARKNERQVLEEVLSALEQLPIVPKLFETAETLIPLQRKQGLSVGLIDYLIAVQALFHGLPLYTIDTSLKKLATKLSVDIMNT